MSVLIAPSSQVDNAWWKQLVDDGVTGSDDKRANKSELTVTKGPHKLCDIISNEKAIK